MEPVSAATLLEVWERGTHQPPIQRALTLLAPFFPELTMADLVGLPVGMRDGLVLLAREWLFGPQMECVARCPACASTLEFVVQTSELRALAPATSAPQCVEIEGHQVSFRLPTSADVLALAAETGGIRQLVERCLLAESGPLSDQAVIAVGAAMTQADPLLHLTVTVTCPECGHEWAAPFDLVTFVWRELDDWARRLLTETHALARAYGWSEREILALSPQRRSFYLRLVNDERSAGSSVGAKF